MLYLYIFRSIKYIKHKIDYNYIYLLNQIVIACFGIDSLFLFIIHDIPTDINDRKVQE